MGKTKSRSRPSFLTSRAFLMTMAALAILIAGFIIGASGTKKTTCEPAAAAPASSTAVIDRG